MPIGDAVSYAWYRYTTKSGTFRSVKIDKTIGDDADFGFTAFNVADPVLYQSQWERPRMIVMQDPVSLRVKKFPVGTQAATAWTSPTFTQTTQYRGTDDAVTMNKIYELDERIRRPRAISNQAEPGTP